MGNLRQSLAQGMQGLIPQPPTASALAGAAEDTNHITLSQMNILPQALVGFD